MNREVRRTAVAILSGATLVFLLGLHAAASPYRSDAELRFQFFEHQMDFEKLVKMARQDRHLERIAPDFTWLDTDVSWPRKNVGISEERWNEYRRLFQRAGVPDGIAKYVHPLQIFFPIAVQGSVVSSQEKGLVYSPTRLTPVLNSLDQRPPDRLYDKKGHVLVFRPLQPHWYIYYEEW